MWLKTTVSQGSL